MTARARSFGSGEVSSRPKLVGDAQNELITSRDYDKVLGISVSLMTSRVVGRTHLGKHKQRRFKYHKLLLEELEIFQKQLVEQAEQDEILANSRSNGIDSSQIEKNRRLEECFFYFDAAMRSIISHNRFFLDTEKLNAEVKPREKTSESQDQSGSSQKFVLPENEFLLLRPSFVVKEERFEKKKREWQQRRVELEQEGVKLHELFFRAAQFAWEIFMPVSNEFKTLEAIAGLKMPDLDDSRDVFTELVIAVRVLISFSFFHILEREVLGIEREYPKGADERILKYTPTQVVDLLFKSSFLTTAKNLLPSQSKGLSMLFRPKANKPKMISDMPKSVRYIMALSLAIDRIVTKYCRVDENNLFPSLKSDSYYKIYNMDKHPSVFQHRVNHPKTTFAMQGASAKSSIFVKRGNMVPDELCRMALITEDADTSLLTASENTEVKLIDANTLKPLANVISPSTKISAVTSNRMWLVFGTSDGTVYLYKVDPESIGTSRSQETPVIDQPSAILTQKYKITAMILNSQDNRLFVGDSFGRIYEWDLGAEIIAEDPKVLDSGDVKLQEICSFTTDERATPLYRFAAKLLFSGHADGTVCIWNILGDAVRFVRAFTAHTRGVTAMAYRDEDLFTGSFSGVIKMWSKLPLTASPEENLNMTAETVRNLNEKVSAIVVDYTVVIAAAGFSLALFERTEFEQVETLFFPSEGKFSVPVVSLAIDRRRRLYTVDREIRIWDLEGLLETINLSPRNARQKKIKKKSKTQRSTLIAHSKLSEETTLMEILNDPGLRRKFNQYLATVRVAEENLHYWLLVERYQYFALTATGRDLGRFGLEIVQEHIYLSSPKPVNISGPDRQRLQALTIDDFKPETFNKTKDDIYQLISRNFKREFIEAYNAGDGNIEAPEDEAMVNEKDLGVEDAHAGDWFVP